MKAPNGKCGLKAQTARWRAVVTKRATRCFEHCCFLASDSGLRNSLTHLKLTGPPIQRPANSLSREEVLKRPITYAVVAMDANFDFANLDRWYERDAGERIGSNLL